MRRKLTALILCMLLCAAGVISPAYARITNAQKVYAKGGADALWELINTRYGQELYQQDGYADLYIWTPDGPSFPVASADNMLHYNMNEVKMQETAGVGFTLEQLVIYASVVELGFVDKDISGDILPEGPIHIDPYGTFSFRVGCPTDGNFRYQAIVAAGTDDNGHPLEFYGLVQRLNVSGEKTAAENPAYDTHNLRYEADYEVEVSDGVWWVPVNTLGKSRYTNREIAGMVEDKPEKKQEEISTLYEALQLYQVSNFSSSDDNVRITENKINWEHHKPGYDAVRTNNGCCASDSNWLNYILAGDYEQVGFIAYSNQDGSGHIFNYIYHDGYYYFIDLTHYRTDFMDAAAPETGYMPDYSASDIVAGNLHRAKEPEDYIRYCINKYNDPPARFFMYQAQDCLPLDGVRMDGRMTITYPEGTPIQVLDGANPTALDVAFVAGPKKTYKWSSLKDAKFRVDEKYLNDESPAQEPLTAYKPGDVLSLEDYGENGFAVIDGIDYYACKSNQCRFGFEHQIRLYGGCNYSYFDFNFPTELHEDRVRDMDSLILGDAMADIVKECPQAQIILCERQGDQLTVREVENQKYYDARHISIRRDENGNWQPTPEYWYLLIRREGEIIYEFGRFMCGIE